MEAVMDIPEIESRVSLTSDVFSLEFSVLISYLLKLRWLSNSNNSAINSFLQLLRNANYSHTNWIANEIFPFFINNQLQNIIQNVPTLFILKSLFRDIKISASTNSDETSICSISKALNLVIVKYDGRAKKEYYSGSDNSPMFVHIICKDNLYYAAFHKNEMLFERNRTQQQLLGEYPFVKPLKAHKPTNFDSDRRLLQRFREKFDKIVKYVSVEDKRAIRECIENFKNNYAGIYNENQQIINAVKASIDIEPFCEKHKLACFPCSTVHCFQCFSINKHYRVCDCGDQINEEFIRNCGLTIIPPINAGYQVRPPPNNPPLALPLAASVTTYNNFQNPNAIPMNNIQQISSCCYSCNNGVDIQYDNCCPAAHYICSNCYPYCQNQCAVCNNHKCGLCNQYILATARCDIGNQIYHYRCFYYHAQIYQANYK